LHTILTDNGIQFADLPRNRDGWTARYRVHRFDQICREHGIEHRLTKPNHPWTNGQVERMNRTIKDATVKRYHYDDHDQLRAHLRNFVDAYNFARRLKTLKGLTPYEFICKFWTSDPNRFKLDPRHQMPGVNTSSSREIDAAFATFAGERPDGLFVAGDLFFNSRRVELVQWASHHRVPAIYASRAYPDVGGLMSYGTDVTDAYRQAGVYTGRILKGAKPADLPVMQASKFELVINAQTARMLGLTVPPGVLAVADEVIE
jgi:hypothetical protein